MATCPQCGSQNADTSASCWKCYAPLKSASPGATAPTPTPTPTQTAAPAPRPVAAPRAKSRRSSPMPIIIVVVLLLAVGGAGVYYWFVMRPVAMAKEVTVEFIKAQVVGDFAKMKELATSGSAQLITLGEQLLASNPQLSQLKNQIKLDKVEPGAVTINGNEAQVAVSISLSVRGAPQSSTQTVSLARENGVWKVNVIKMGQEILKQYSQMMPQLGGGGGLRLPGLPGMGGR